MSISRKLLAAKSAISSAYSKAFMATLGRLIVPPMTAANTASKALAKAARRRRWPMVYVAALSWPHVVGAALAGWALLTLEPLTDVPWLSTTEKSLKLLLAVALAAQGVWLSSRRWRKLHPRDPSKPGRSVRIG